MTIRLQTAAGFTLVEAVISVSLLVLCLAGMINGYIYSSRSAEYAAYVLAGQQLAVQKSEQVRAATWDLGRDPAVDEVVADNFPPQTIALDMPIKGTNVTYALVTTTITLVRASPPLKCVKIVCTWPWIGGKTGTNEMVTYRAPDALGEN